MSKDKKKNQGHSRKKRLSEWQKQSEYLQKKAEKKKQRNELRKKC